jgi:DNA/RNA endonuclease YhcR with UshA esterase domain
MRATLWAAWAALFAASLPAIPIGDLSASMDGQSVTVEGTVSEFSASTYDRQPNRLTVTDGSGTVQVVIWPDVFSQITPAPGQGTSVTVQGTVGEYRGQLQVRVADRSGVTVAAGDEPAPAAATAAVGGDTTPLSSITAAMQGETVTIRGTVESIRPSGNPQAPNTLTVTDGSGTLPVVIWPEVFDALNPQPSAGGTLHATGQVSVYRETVQVACRDAAQIALVDDSGDVVSSAPEAAPSTAPAAPEESAVESAAEAVRIAVSDIDGSTVGQNVIVEGTVVSLRPSWSERAPNIITLSDGTSAIPAVSWSDTWDPLERKPAQGDRIRLTGQVSVYEARNEIQIRLQDLEFLE